MVTGEKMFNAAETQKNIYTYHDVIAGSLAAIYNDICAGHAIQAREIMIMNILYASALNGKFYDDAEIIQLQKQSLYHLIQKMAEEQKKANLIPTQIGYGTDFFSRIEKKIYELEMQEVKK